MLQVHISSNFHFVKYRIGKYSKQDFFWGLISQHGIKFEWVQNPLSGYQDIMYLLTNITHLYPSYMRFSAHV